MRTGTLQNLRLPGRPNAVSFRRSSALALQCRLAWRSTMSADAVTPGRHSPTRPDGIESRILLIRGQRVMLSPTLAELYGVQPKVLVQAVKRNRSRFPADFLFQLTAAEFQILKSQFVTSSWGGIRRAMPLAFTEQGVAMLSSVLRSPRAIAVNIEIIRAFVQLRRMLDSNTHLAKKIRELERKYDGQFRAVFDAIRELMSPPTTPRRAIGFRSRPAS